MDRMDVLYDVAWQLQRVLLDDWREPKEAYGNLVRLAAYYSRARELGDPQECYFRLMRILNVLNSVRLQYNDGTFDLRAVNLIQDAIWDFLDEVKKFPEPDWEVLTWDWEKVAREIENIASANPEALSLLYRDFYKRTLKGDESTRPSLFQFFRLLDGTRRRHGIRKHF